MQTHAMSREFDKFFIAKINNLVAEDRESLIPSIATEYEQLCRAQAGSTNSPTPDTRGAGAG